MTSSGEVRRDVESAKAAPGPTGAGSGAGHIPPVTAVEVAPAVTPTTHTGTDPEFDRMCAEFSDWMLFERGRSRQTITAYRSDLNAFGRWMGERGMELDAIDAAAIRSWRSIKTRVTLFTLAIFLISLWSLALYASRVLRADS